MKLDPATKIDFHRIYNHHENYSSEERADEIDEQLYYDAGICDSYQTATHRGLTYKRVRNGYRLFYAPSQGINIIYAVFHATENWQNLIESRHGTFSDA